MLRQLLAGRVNLAGKFNPPTFEDTRIDVFAYLIAIDREVILVDTGVGFGNDYVDTTFAPSDRVIVDELLRSGFRPDDVTIVVNSHLHFDHCGTNATFENAAIYVQERELEIARSTRYTVNEWFDYDAANLHVVDGDHQPHRQVTLLTTPGHTPGHQSALIDDGTTRTIIAAQASFTADEFKRGGDPGVQAHDNLEDQYVTSIKRLASPGAHRIVFSHDRHEVINLPAG